MLRTIVALYRQNKHLAAFSILLFLGLCSSVLAERPSCELVSSDTGNFSEKNSRVTLRFSEPVLGMHHGKVLAKKTLIRDFKIESSNSLSLQAKVKRIKIKIKKAKSKRQKKLLRKKIKRKIKKTLADTFSFKLDVRFGKNERERLVELKVAARKARNINKELSLACNPLVVKVYNPKFKDQFPTPSPTLSPTTTPSPVPTPDPEPTREPTSEPTPDLPPEPLPVCNSSAPKANNSSNITIFPGAEGFGTNTTAGSGRSYKNPCTTVYKVTSLKNEGPGTLRECIEAEGPRVCIFEISGSIWASKELKITNPHLTIAGQTAPEPGIMIRGSGISVEASDILIRHIRLRVGDDPIASCCDNNSCNEFAEQFCAQDYGSRDGIRVFAKNNAIENIVIDHVSIAWALDENFSIAPYRGNVENVTFSNSIISSALDVTLHPEADPGHSKGVLINSSKEVKNLSFHHNLLAHNADRNIRIAVPISMEYVNNVVYNWARGSGGGRLIEMYNSRNAVHSIDLIGNTYQPGLDSYCPETYNEPKRCLSLSGRADSENARKNMHYIFRIGSGKSGGLSSASRYFINDNFGATRSSSSQDQWDIVDKGFFKDRNAGVLHYPQNKANAPVSSSSSISVQQANAAKNHVLANAGARPKARDSVDQQTISEVKNKTGRIINCVQADNTERCALNAGGWPHYPVNTRSLRLPNNPHGDDNGDGYTNLEEWLEDFARHLE